MYKKSNSFAYIYVADSQFFSSNTVRIYPIKLKIDMPYHMNQTFLETVFYISATVT